MTILMELLRYVFHNYYNESLKHAMLQNLD